MQAKSALYKAFEAAGFTLVRCTGHAIWRCPCGHAQVASPTSPGYGRSSANSKALIARTLRACTPQQQRRAA